MKTAAIRLNIPNIRLYDIFRKDLHLPDERAHDLVLAIDEAVKRGCEENLKGVATKEFVKDEIRATKEFVRDEIQATKEFVRDEIQATKEFVRDEIQATKEFVKDEIQATKELVRGEIQVVKNDIQSTKDFVKSEINRVELKVEQTKSDLTKSIFWTSLVQFLAIIGAVIGIISFMFRK